MPLPLVPIAIVASIAAIGAVGTAVYSIRKGQREFKSFHDSKQAENNVQVSDEIIEKEIVHEI